MKFRPIRSFTPVVLSVMLAGCPRPSSDDQSGETAEGSGATTADETTEEATELAAANDPCSLLSAQLATAPTSSPDIDSLRSRLGSSSAATVAEVLREIGAYGELAAALSSDVEAIVAGDDPILRRHAWAALLSIEPTEASDAALQQWRGANSSELRFEAARAMATASDASLELLVSTLAREDSEAQELAASALLMALEEPVRANEIVFGGDMAFCSQLERRECRALYRRLGFLELLEARGSGNYGLIEAELAIQNGEDAIEEWVAAANGGATLATARVESALELSGILGADALWEPMLEALIQPASTVSDRMRAGAWLLEHSVQTEPGSLPEDELPDDAPRGVIAMRALLDVAVNGAESPQRDIVQAVLDERTVPEVAGDAALVLTVVDGEVPDGVPVYLAPMLPAVAAGLTEVVELPETVGEHDVRLLGALVSRMGDPDAARATIVEAYEATGDVRWLEMGAAADVPLESFTLTANASLQGASLSLLVRLHEIAPELVVSELGRRVADSTRPRDLANSLRAATLLEVVLDPDAVNSVVVRPNSGLRIDIHAHRWWAVRYQLAQGVDPETALAWLDGVSPGDSGAMERYAGARVVYARACAE